MRALVLVAALTWTALAAAADPSGSGRFTADGVEVAVNMDETAYSAGAAALMTWIKRSMDIVTRYYGRFPDNVLRIELIAEPGGGVHTGKTWSRHGGFIRIQLGREVTPDQLLNDWVLVHEMTHLALPDLSDDHAWLSEGLAVYIEGIERVQAGNRTAEDVFAEQLHAMPRGLPQPGDRGLDHTHTWARTYWGGAMFCFLADVRIHQETANRYGLQDAMRAVLQKSGGLSSDWPIDRVLATGDAATGTHVLATLYAQMKDAAVKPDLPELWRELGIEADGNSVKLRDDAPLAAVRRAIMQPRASRTQS